jgi:hypothetical protein
MDDSYGRKLNYVNVIPSVAKNLKLKETLEVVIHAGKGWRSGSRG